MSGGLPEGQRFEAGIAARVPIYDPVGMHLSCWKRPSRCRSQTASRPLQPGKSKSWIVSPAASATRKWAANSLLAIRPSNTYVTSLLEKLDVRNRVEAALLGQGRAIAVATRG